MRNASVKLCRAGLHPYSGPNLRVQPRRGTAPNGHAREFGFRCAACQDAWTSAARKAKRTRQLVGVAHP